jgi:dTMP kinase
MARAITEQGSEGPDVRGKFITLEGIDGAGKSTHLTWLAGYLTARGITLCVTREPGGTPLGEKLRALLLDKDQPMHLETETLLMFAARREHIDKIIEPALARGEWVLCDRFTDATFAYQGAGRGVDRTKLGVLEQWVQGGLQPDLTIVFDLPPAVGRARAGSIKVPDRFERENEAFFERVREGYLQRAQAAPRRIRVVDASRSITDVQADLTAIVVELCP